MLIGTKNKLHKVIHKSFIICHFDKDSDKMIQ